jgi:hypothetical protein
LIRQVGHAPQHAHRGEQAASPASSCAHARCRIRRRVHGQCHSSRDEAAGVRR